MAPRFSLGNVVRDDACKVHLYNDAQGYLPRLALAELGWPVDAGGTNGCRLEQALLRMQTI